MNWFYGGYPDPLKTVLRGLLVLFIVVFTAHWWSDIDDTAITIASLAIIVVQVILARGIGGGPR